MTTQKRSGRLGVLDAQDAVTGKPAIASRGPRIMMVVRRRASTNRRERGNERRRRRYFDGAIRPVVLRAGSRGRGSVEARQKQVATLGTTRRITVRPPGLVRDSEKIFKGTLHAGLDYVSSSAQDPRRRTRRLKKARAYWRAKGQGTRTRLDRPPRRDLYGRQHGGGISVRRR